MISNDNCFYNYNEKCYIKCNDNYNEIFNYNQNYYYNNL